MTKSLIRKHCKDNSLYDTPELNDVLYLHYKGEYHSKETVSEVSKNIIINIFKLYRIFLY